MAYTFFLQAPEGSLSSEIAPEHGGMVAQLYLGDKSMLTLDRAMLETAPMAAGGMPLLFPFPSKTKDDLYTLSGKSYFMPMHGLVKNTAFGIKNVASDSAVIWMEASHVWQAQYYPFDFRLEVCYRIERDCLHIDTAVTNRSLEAMPHYLGWHPFFRSSDKTRISLEHSMTTHYDYVSCLDRPSLERLDLSSRLDDVFHTPCEHRFVLTNEADGYEVDCRFDEAFSVMVVCSWVRDSMCVEPWCGLPDSIHQNRFVRWVPPGMTKHYGVEMIFRNIG